MEMKQGRQKSWLTPFLEGAYHQHKNTALLDDTFINIVKHTQTACNTEYWTTALLLQILGILKLNLKIVSFKANLNDQI